MKLSLDAVKKSVESALKRIPNAPRIEVRPNVGSVGLTAPSGTVPKGVTLDDGSIIIFSDAAESVLFHGQVSLSGWPDYTLDCFGVVARSLALHRRLRFLNRGWQGASVYQGHDSGNTSAHHCERQPITKPP